MSQLFQDTAALCALLLAVELIAHLAPKNKMLGFTRGLAVLVLLASSIASFAGANWDWPDLAQPGAWENQELESYMEDQYQAAAEEHCRQYLQGLLAAGGIEAKKILPQININEDGSIVFTGVALQFHYESDAQRARALLAGALGQEVEIEVMWDAV